MQTLTKLQTNLPTTQEEETDNLLAATQGYGSEKLLKFRKGKFFVMQEEVPLGTEYVAHASEMTYCWIKFSADGQVVERRHGRAADGYEPPKREELDDWNDKSKWRVIDGVPRDPWAFQHLLPLEHLETGALSIFTTGSVGGEIGVKELVYQWAKRAKKGQRSLPIIKLASIDMMSKKYGAVPRPHFPVVGWDDVVPSAGGGKMSTANQLDDAIPF